LDDNIKLIIACEVFKSELEQLKDQIKVPILWVEHSLHNLPNKLRLELQKKIDEAEKQIAPGSTVLLMFGNCGGALEGIGSKTLRLIYPEVHDCTPILLGSVEKYEKLQLERPGSFYFNHAWIESGNNPLGKHEYYVKRYGKELALELSQEIYKNYTHFVLINNNCGDLPKAREYVKRACEKFNKQYAEEIGDLSFIIRILNNQYRMVNILPKEANAVKDNTIAVEDHLQERYFSSEKPLVMGIDTGGTYTDGVLIDLSSNAIVKKYKTETTHHDLAICIKETIKNLLANVQEEKIARICVSTTLATNMILENKGGKVALILIGYDHDLMKKYRFYDRLGAQAVGLFAGGHDVKGKQKEELDVKGIESFVKQHTKEVDAFAVSSYFSVYNPSHEQRVKRIIKEIAEKPVVCGHELSEKLDSVKRAATASLNAKLIPEIKKLIDGIITCMKELDLKIPLFIVKGDGSIVSYSIAQERPIETILSGPAASAIGAKDLGKQKTFIVIDIGGTSTDVGMCKDETLKINPLGVKINDIYTHVNALDMVTIALGGDSKISFRDDEITVGPDRVLPMCRLALQYPRVGNYLRALPTLYIITEELQDYIDFAYIDERNKRIDSYNPETELQQRIIEELRKGPMNIKTLSENLNTNCIKLRRVIKELNDKKIINWAGFTPTDLGHSMDLVEKWDKMSSKNVFKFICRVLNKDEELIRQKIEDEIYKKLLISVFDVMRGESVYQYPAGEIARTIVYSKQNSLFSLSSKFNIPIIAVGAPAKIFTNRINKFIDCHVIIPDNHEVANAVGAAMGKIVIRTKGKIECDNKLAQRPVFKVYNFMGITEFVNLESAYSFFLETGKSKLEAEAKYSGAKEYVIKEYKKEYDDDKYYYKMDIELIAYGNPF